MGNTFQEVLKQYKRLCAAHVENGGCPTCLLYRAGHTCICKGYMPDEWEGIDIIEEIIMEWAEKNPEPKYPTWFKWLLKTGLIKQDENGGFEWTSMTDDSIPDDFARKNGIQPI